MNRSQRCAAVVSRAITAVVVCAGAALTFAVPAEGEPAGSDTIRPGISGRPGSSGRTADRDHSPGDRSKASRSTGATTPRHSRHSLRDAGDGQQWPCDWPSNWHPGNVDDDGGDVIPVQPAFKVPTVPVAQISGGVEPRSPGPDRAPVPLTAPLPAPNSVPGPTAQSLPAVSAPRPTAPAQSLPGRRNAVPPPTAPRTAAPLTAPAPGRQPQRPAVAADAPDLFRLGYPPELRHADLATMAALALPGLAAIVAMTALGGFVGYRQAKAGCALTPAGAGRFLP